MDISELLSRVSNAISENNLSGVIDDVQMLLGEIDNLNNSILDLSVQVEDLTKEKNTLTSEIEMNRKTIANLVRQIPVKEKENIGKNEIEETNFIEILEDMLTNG